MGIVLWFKKCLQRSGLCLTNLLIICIARMTCVCQIYRVSSVSLLTA